MFLSDIHNMHALAHITPVSHLGTF